ncbi:Predicted arabinose efflux permease, MFS family [Actinopolyspora mzabensis]|uniref:Predicted arabinose efflux permease, MFS family n=1 Tax=Actinopolyspora mzabensis TaxID=995066 RepID=A0A1G9EHF4_ACTMZ|nr:MFS transporter [Actinopolyspora mzabensis]SDK75579.1 Predicted arabinose efflux permease, MFS family [Actinopolyspora mzabensis]
MSTTRTKGVSLPKGLSPQLALLLVCVVCTQTTLNLARPLISYRTISLGGGEVAVGLITAAYAMLSLVVALPLGRYTDRHGGTVPVLLTGTCLLVAAPLWLASSTSLPGVTVGSAVLGLGHIVFMMGGQRFITTVSADDALDRNFGLFTAAVSVGQMLGPLGSGLLLGQASGDALTGATSEAFLVGALTAAVGVLPALLLRRGTSGTPPAPDSGEQRGTLSLLRRPGMATGLFTSLALLGAVDLLTAYLPLIAENRGIAPALAGTLLAVRSAASILSRLGLGYLAARWQRRTLIVTSCLGAGTCLTLVTAPGLGVVAMAAALGVGGFLLGIGQPLTMTAVVRTAGAANRGSGLALRLWTNRAGQVALPACASAVSGSLGAASALLFAAVLLLATGGLARFGGGELPAAD